MPEDKRTKVKKGWLAVQVGLEGEDETDRAAGAGSGVGLKRFVIPISHLHHPLFAVLLDKAKEVYGYSTAGPLRLPCSIDDFLHLRWLIERETAQLLLPNQPSCSLTLC